MFCMLRISRMLFRRRKIKSAHLEYKDPKDFKDLRLNQLMQVKK